MARSTSSNPNKPRTSSSGTSRQTPSSGAPTLEPWWKRAALAVPRALGAGVRGAGGTGEFDPAYRRDGLCFVMIVLAVFFIGSEWFRVDGALGRVLHAFAAGLFGVMSIVVPVLLILVAVRLMRNAGKGSGNPRVIAGWAMLLWSVCSIIDVVMAADTKTFSWGNLQRAGGLLGFVIGSPLAWGLSQTFAIIVFVVSALFSVLLITRTHVTDIPDTVRSLAGKAPRKRTDDEDDRQFPNEVRVGDNTLAFADGVPAHDGSDEESGAVRKPGFFARLFHRHRHEDSDAGLDHYAGDVAFLNAASRHG